MSLRHGEDAMSKPATCEDCGKHFRKETDLMKHMSTTHNPATGGSCNAPEVSDDDCEEEPYRCNTYDAFGHAKIASTKELDSREQAAIGSSGNVPEVSDDDFEEEPYMCDICNKKIP